MKRTFSSKTDIVFQILPCYFNHKRKDTLYHYWQRCRESHRLVCHYIWYLKKEKKKNSHNGLSSTAFFSLSFNKVFRCFVFVCLFVCLFFVLFCFVWFCFLFLFLFLIFCIFLFCFVLSCFDFVCLFACFLSVCFLFVCFLYVCLFVFFFFYVWMKTK